MDVQRVFGDRPKPYVMAHRGNSARHPENTMAAFRQAVEDGADIIETDLHVSADGILMCIHDETVDRTTDGQGKVRDMICSELQALNANYGHVRSEVSRIPTLQAVLEMLPENMGIALELKADDFLEESVCQRLHDLLKDTGSMERVVALSFSRERLRAIKQYAPAIPTGLISMTNLFPETEWTMAGSFWPLMILNPFYTWLGHKNGQLICPLDPEPDARLWFYRFVGCDAVLTNDSAQTRRALRRAVS